MNTERDSLINELFTSFKKSTLKSIDKEWQRLKAEKKRIGEKYGVAASLKDIEMEIAFNRRKYQRELMDEQEYKAEEERLELEYKAEEERLQTERQRYK